MFTFPRNPATRGKPLPGARDLGTPSHEPLNRTSPIRGFALDGLRQDGVPYTFAPDSILRLNSVIEITGLSRSSIYNYIKAGTFPRPLKLGLRAVGWLASEVFEWIATRGHNA